MLFCGERQSAGKEDGAVRGIRGGSSYFVILLHRISAGKGAMLNW